jgi:formate C-acetyltransferase
MKVATPSIEAARIARIRNRYRTEIVRISIERARHYTQAFEETAGEEVTQEVRVALAMKRVYEQMNHCLDPDDRIAGCWTEFFLGVPIDIERGVFNGVLDAELTTPSLVVHRAKSLARTLVYLVRRGDLVEFVRNQLDARANGKPPLDIGLHTMAQREINAFTIAKDDLRVLKKELLPRWRGRSLVDLLERELSDSGLVAGDMQGFAKALMGSTSRQVLMLSSCSTISSLQGHVILDYESVLRLGLAGMKARIEKQLSCARTPRARSALDSQQIALEGVMIFARRLCDRIAREMCSVTDPARRAELELMLDCCQRVPIEPATSFRQAVQSLWTVKTAVELAHPMNLHCFGRLDQILYPFYAEDLSTGRIEASSALVLLQELLLKIMSQNIRLESGLLSNFYHRYLGSSPVTVGGLRPDGHDGTNALTYLFLEAAHESRAVTNMSVRVHDKTPAALLERVAEYLAAGSSCFSLFNDATHIEALRRSGIPDQDARNYALMGCVEASIPGKTGSMSANALLLSRLLDMTLRNGDSKILAGTLTGQGPATGAAEQFGSFEEFWAALALQVRSSIDRLAAGSNLRDRLTAEVLPAPLISAFMDGCLDSAKDVTRGGARYDQSGISMINSIANLADSLYVIDELVFARKRFSLPELVAALDDNFVGHEHILQSIQGLTGRWGNAFPRSDRLAARLLALLVEETRRHRSFKGAPFVVHLISMITHTIDGRMSIASPDGRLAGVPFAASCNPANVERSGVTAVMRSVAGLPFEDVTGCAVNLKFHPSAVGRSPETRAKWASLVRTYFKLGGAQLQPTCVSARMLQQARQRPELNRDLIVKVGGYSTYFVDLGREIQQEIIDRTEHRCGP